MEAGGSVKPYYDEQGITIYHGDCREIQAWLAADVMVSDPPYGQRFRSVRNGTFGDCRVTGDDDTTVRDEALEMWGEKPALISGRWSVPRPPMVRAVLIWDKGDHVGMGDVGLPWKPNTEEIYVLGRGFVGHRGSGVLRHLAAAGTVARAQDFTRFHPTQKPVSLMVDLLQKCPPEWLVADPFMGSGTTLRAAKDLGRQAIGIEIEERYCEIAAKRLAQCALFGVVS